MFICSLHYLQSIIHHSIHKVTREAYRKSSLPAMKIYSCINLNHLLKIGYCNITSYPVLWPLYQKQEETEDLSGLLKSYQKA